MPQEFSGIAHEPGEAGLAEFRAGTGLAATGNLAAACRRYERATQLEPRVARFHFQLAVCQWRLGRLEAESSFRRAIEADPQFATAHSALSGWYLEHGLIEPADAASRAAMALTPDDPAAIHARASMLEVTGDIGAAWDLISPLVGPGNVPMPVLRLCWRMAAHQPADRQAEALAQIELHLANGNWGVRDRARLHFTAAELLDRMGRYEQAFGQASMGNRLARTPYDPAAHERTFDILINYFTREKMASLPVGTDRTGKPVFIVGMPRSGTSLVEQILASHPAVHGGGEMDLMSQVWSGTVQMLGATPEQYPGCVDRLTVDQIDGMAQVYLQPLIAMDPAAARITDKLPLNFLHLGLVALLLPGARVIDCRRDPRDTCLSCFFAMFQEGNDFKFELDHTAHFYLQHRRLMDHWRQSLDLPILQVSYEELATDPETQTRRMLDFLGLPWDDRCLRFHENRRPVTSSSRQQVRRPMYRSSIGRWRNYQSQLAGLDRWFSQVSNYPSGVSISD